MHFWATLYINYSLQWQTSVADAAVVSRRLTDRSTSCTTWVCRVSQSANWSLKWTMANITCWGLLGLVRTPVYNWMTGRHTSNTRPVSYRAALYHSMSIIRETDVMYFV